MIKEVEARPSPKPSAEIPHLLGPSSHGEVTCKAWMAWRFSVSFGSSPAGHFGGQFQTVAFPFVFKRWVLCLVGLGL